MSQIEIPQNIHQTLSEKSEKIENINTYFEFDWDNMNANQTYILKKLFSDGFEKKVLEKLPNKINFNDLNFNQSDLLKFLSEKGFASNIYNRLQLTNEISWENLKPYKSRLLIELHRSGFAKNVFEKLPKKINWDNLSKNDNTELIIELCNYKFLSFESILNQLPTDIRWNSLKLGQPTLLVQLCRNGFAKNVFEKLQKIISWKDISFEISDLIIELYLNNFITIDQILDQIPDDADINKFQGGQLLFLSSMCSNGFAKNVFEKLCNKSNFYLDMNSYAQKVFIHELVSNGYAEQIFDLTYKNINWASLNISNSIILGELSENGLAKRILEMIPNEIDYKDINNYQLAVIIKIAKSGYKKDILEKFKRLSVREKIYISNDDKVPIGGQLEKVVKNFPILGYLRKNNQNNFNVLELKKDGSSSRVFIKNHSDPNKIVIIFRNYNIPKENLNAYKKALSIIPDYVSSPYYQELANDNEKLPIQKIRSSGFREVFAGLSVDHVLDIELPTSLEDNITRQVNYIKFQIETNGIDHEHPHERNFNVRFLIEHNGEKKLFFEPKDAVEYARENQAPITPIVILRDWDAA